MRWLLISLAALLAVTAEVTLFARIQPWLGGLRPDAALAVAVLAALAARTADTAATAAWLAGLLADLPSGDRLGLHALMFLAAGSLAYGLKRVVAGETALGQVILVGVLSLAVGAAEGAAATGRGGAGVWLTAGNAVGTALLTALLVPFVRLLAGPALERIGGAERRR